ncbi:MAG TPA: hypothetical protein VNM67_05110 [Thermoanaerobaculia bacterium]|nr:hypothetical protein [Thermoanaerobaculia bacterium]
MDKVILEYRQHLILAEQKAQDDYDKGVLTLAGGGLGISLAFVEKVVGSGTLVYPNLLVGAWLCWTGSIASVLISYFLSRHALRCAIAQVDGHVQVRRLGGSMAVATEVANSISGLLFVIGAVLISIFAVNNLETKNAKDTKTVESTPSPSIGYHDQERLCTATATATKATHQPRLRPSSTPN